MLSRSDAYHPESSSFSPRVREPQLLPGKGRAKRRILQSRGLRSAEKWNIENSGKKSPSVFFQKYPSYCALLKYPFMISITTPKTLRVSITPRVYEVGHILHALTVNNAMIAGGEPVHALLSWNTKFEFSNDLIGGPSSLR